jgi:hypothetical protein
MITNSPSGGFDSQLHDYAFDQARRRGFLYDDALDIAAEAVLRTYCLIQGQGRIARTNPAELRRLTTTTVRLVALEASRERRRRPISLPVDQGDAWEARAWSVDGSPLIIRPIPHPVDEPFDAQEAVKRLREKAMILLVRELGADESLAIDIYRTRFTPTDLPDILRAEMPNATNEEIDSLRSTRQKRISRWIDPRLARLEEWNRENGVHIEWKKSPGTRKKVSGDSVFSERLRGARGRPSLRGIRLSYLSRRNDTMTRLSNTNVSLLPLTAHATERGYQRGIREMEIALALCFGKRFWKKGKRICFLGRRHLPAHLPHDVARRAEGTVVVVAADGAICTVFRDRNFPKRMRHQ